MLMGLIFFISTHEAMTFAATKVVLFPFSLQNDAVLFF